MPFKRPALPLGFRPILPALGSLARHLLKAIGESVQPLMTGSALHRMVNPTNMASADFCCPIPPPLDGSSTRQNNRSPRVRCATFTLIPAAFTTVLSVQVSGFEDTGLLTQHDRLVCDSCSSGQCFACGFLQIPPRGGHPCRSANRSPYRAGRGLSPPSHPIATTAVGIAPIQALRAMPGAQIKRQSHC